MDAACAALVTFPIDLAGRAAASGHFSSDDIRRGQTIAQSSNPPCSSLCVQVCPGGRLHGARQAVSLHEAGRDGLHSLPPYVTGLVLRVSVGVGTASSVEDVGDVLSRYSFLCPAQVGVRGRDHNAHKRDYQESGTKEDDKDVRYRQCC